MQTFFNTENFNKTASRAASAVPYIFTLYFIELAYFTPAFIYMFGRAAGFLTVIALTAAYSVQTVMLYMKNETARRIQLTIMDIHAAFTIGYTANFISGMEGFGPYDTFLFSVRLVLLIAEISAVAALTSEGVKMLFKKPIPSRPAGR